METKHGGTPVETVYLFENVWGLPGTGKTTYALTHPWPFYVVNCDRQMDHLLALLPPEVEIHYVDALLKPGDKLAVGIATRILHDFEELVNKALGIGEGTFIIDGGQTFWDTIKAVLLPAGDDKRGYEIPNNYFKSALLTLEAAPLHVVITHPAVHPWESMSKESPRLKADSFKHLDASTTLDIYTYDPNRADSLDPALISNAHKGPNLGTPAEYWGCIWRNKLNGATTGLVMKNLTFLEVYLRTTGKVWPGPLWHP